MATVPAFEAKSKFSELLNRVAAGEEIVITRHEKAVARLIPEGVSALAEVRRAAEGLVELQREIAAGPAGGKRIPWTQIKSFVEEGRP